MCLRDTNVNQELFCVIQSLYSNRYRIFCHQDFTCYMNIQNLPAFLPIFLIQRLGLNSKCIEIQLLFNVHFKALTEASSIQEFKLCEEQIYSKTYFLQIVWRFFNRLKIFLPYDTAVPLPASYMKNTKAVIQRETQTPMFIAASFIIAKLWK